MPETRLRLKQVVGPPDRSCSGFASSAVPAIANSIPSQAGSEGYTCFRTPALAIAAKGVVLVFSGVRLEYCKDDCDHDLVLCRSFDGGLTWGPL
jgi:sialidase-1